MALMYDMETVNRAMTEAAKLYDPKRPSIRVKRVLDIFAGIKPVQAVQVIRCMECRRHLPNTESDGFLYCCFWRTRTLPSGFCHMGAKMDGEVVEE